MSVVKVKVSFLSAGTCVYMKNTDMPTQTSLIVHYTIYTDNTLSKIGVQRSDGSVRTMEATDETLCCLLKSKERAGLLQAWDRLLELSLLY